MYSVKISGQMENVVVVRPFQSTSVWILHSMVDVTANTRCFSIYVAQKHATNVNYPSTVQELLCLMINCQLQWKAGK